MRILLYGLNFAPELIGVGKYTGEFAEWLVSRGHELCVVTAPPYYPQWRIQKGYSSYRYTKEPGKNLNIHRCPLWVPQYHSAIKRILHLSSFALSSLPVVVWQAFRFRPVLVIVIAPTILCAPGGIIAAHFVKAKAWLHFQDLEIDAAFGISLLRGGVLRSVVRKCERWILGQFDRISGITEQMNQRLVSKGCDPGKIIVFPNWVDTSTVHPIEEKEKIRAEFHLQKDAFIVMYSGNLGAKQGLHVLVETARLLSDYPKIHFVIAGDGVYRETLQHLTSGLRNMTFLPLQPVDRFTAFLNTADIHIVAQLSGIADSVMPSKLLGILASGGAVVAIVQEETGLARIIEESGGIIASPENPVSIRNILVAISRDENRLNEMKIQARGYSVRHFEKEKILAEIEKQVVSLGNQCNPSPC
jgi:colanic acid biosynthesis glycosyl transferase WcaI